MSIDAGTITLIQSSFIQHINGAFETVSYYAKNLLYIFATFEIVIFGLMWAIKRDLGLERLFFKIIKIGLIFFVIQNYTWLVDIILKSFAQIAGVVLQDASIAGFIFNPAKIWQFGYNTGLLLLQIAAQGNNFGLTLIQIIIGMGILFTFGLLGIQVVLQIVSLYLVAMTGLILAPFGAFEKTSGMFDNSIKVVLQAAIRVMTLIIIIGVGTIIWSGIDLGSLANATAKTITIGPPLGLFFTALLFLYLAIYLPKTVADSVGKIGSFAITETPSIIVTPPSSTIAPATLSSSGMVDMAAATTISTTSGTLLGETSHISQVSPAAEVASSAASNGSGASERISGQIFETAKALELIAKSQSGDRSVSEHGIKQLKEMLEKR